MRVVFWGTFDLGKPRNRILLRGLREAGAEVLVCHTPVWSGVEDKSRLSPLHRLGFLRRGNQAHHINCPPLRALGDDQPPL